MILPMVFIDQSNVPCDQVYIHIFACLAANSANTLSYVKSSTVNQSRVRYEGCRYFHF